MSRPGHLIVAVEVGIGIAIGTPERDTIKIVGLRHHVDDGCASVLELVARVAGARRRRLALIDGNEPHEPARSHGNDVAVEHRLPLGRDHERLDGIDVVELESAGL